MPDPHIGAHPEDNAITIIPIRSQHTILLPTMLAASDHPPPALLIRFTGVVWVVCQNRTDDVREPQHEQRFGVLHLCVSPAQSAQTSGLFSDRANQIRWRVPSHHPRRRRQVAASGKHNAIGGHERWSLAALASLPS